MSDTPSAPETDLDALEQRALERAVALADAEIERGEVVEHERVRAWLLDLAQGLDRPAPGPADRS